MTRKEGRAGAESASARRGPRRHFQWLAAALSVGLLVAAERIAARSGMPLAVSVLDVLVLVALAVVAGIYAILARAERETSAGREEGHEASDEPPQ